jgi:ubiquinone/menaquinone biosynthesis C-methylase UbiE
MGYNQKDEFLKNEGNEWFARNRNSLNKSDDYVIDIIIQRQLKPKNVLEIGCSNGWRLNIIQKLLNSECYGIDPSNQAIIDGRQKNPLLNLEQGTADLIPFNDKKFDLIIFGFCLYLCDRRDLFKIVYETDRFLNEKGYLIIYDFEPSFPYKNHYQHKDGLFSYKMNYSNLFLSNPSYFLIVKNILTHQEYDNIEDPNERISVTLMMKSMENDYVSNPFL